MLSIDRILRISASPEPLRVRLVRELAKRFRLGSYANRLAIEAVERPFYGWCVYSAALQAKALGHRAITVVEMGVAGGNGLLALCDHADEVFRATGVSVRVFGFDAATGLPASDDPRDLPYAWPAGSFRMDVERLKKRIRNRAELRLGDVVRTLTEFRPEPSAPLGAVMFDLDLYTSTARALAILDAEHRIPRVWCWFDDIIGSPDNLYCERNGERAAIAEYNSAHSDAMLSPAYCSFERSIPRYWHQQIYIDHRFAHSQYSQCLSPDPHELPLR